MMREQTSLRSVSDAPPAHTGRDFVVFTTGNNSIKIAICQWLLAYIPNKISYFGFSTDKERSGLHTSLMKSG